MVALGRALVAGPRLLLLDEPSLGLAPIVTKTLFAALKEIAERTPILLVEQNTAMAFRLCTRVRDGGRTDRAHAAPPTNSADRSALVASYLGRRSDHRERRHHASPSNRRQQTAYNPRS